MNSSPFFTVFTPVFNGEKHIQRVCESIQQQQFKDFEWIVINDGSTDNTAQIIKDFIKSNPEIDVTFLEQENSGKHIAWNRALHHAKGFFFVPADADDYFFPNSLSFFHEKWSKLSTPEQNTTSGLNVLCYDNDSNVIVGDKFPVDEMRSNNLDLSYKYKLKGEKWGCIRVDLLQQRPFPAIASSHYPEGYLWFSLAKHYQVICFNEPLRRYYTTQTGIMQSAIQKKRTVKGAKVMLQYRIWFLRNFSGYLLRTAPREIISNLLGIIGNMLVILRLRS